MSQFAVDGKSELTLDTDTYREGCKMCQKLWAQTADLHKKCTAVPDGLSVKSNTSLHEETVGSECVEKEKGT